MIEQVPAVAAEVHSTMQITDLVSHAFAAMVGGMAVYFGTALGKKIIKKDCSDCTTVQQLQAEITNISRILLDISIKLGIDAKGLIK
jgi:hypothetical protein